MNISLQAKVDGFEVIEELGSGAYGTTYLVQDENRHLYALKWFRPGAPEDALMRFQNETFALQQISHSAFPRFVRQGRYKGRPYIVMSYFEGSTIEAYIEKHVQDHSFFGEMQVLLVAQRVLEAVHHIYTEHEGLVHRDLKDSNIMISLSGDRIAILDLGQCKGPAVPAKEATFWNIGASRISPPAKLEYPSAEAESHEVFAVGVLCYRMLTGRYPWEVAPKYDSGHLKNAMLESQPIPVSQYNSAVDPRTEHLVRRMLDVQDFSRIDAADAIKELENLRVKFEEEFLARGHTPTPAHMPLRLTRIIRDPVYGDIPMSDLEFRIINTQEFQRLRRIRQLGTTNLVFPGAEHTRFSHALGTLFITEKVLATIEIREGERFLSRDRQIARAFSLLHDISHAPFGHTLEDELGFFGRHDKNKRRLERIIHGRESELGPLLMATEVGRRTIDLIYGSEENDSLGWVVEAVSSSVGADVIDYINRDSMFCGLDHRVDSAIFRRFTIETSTGRGAEGRHLVPSTRGSHGFRPDAEYAISSLLRERFALFMKVYSHPVKVAAGAMIGKALAEAMHFAPARFAEEHIERMGDDELLFRIQMYGGNQGRKLVECLQRRHIYKPVYTARLLRGDSVNRDGHDAKRRDLLELGVLEPGPRRELEKEIAEESGVEDTDVIIYATARPPGAQRVVQRVMGGDGRTRVRDEAFGIHQEIYKSHLKLWNAFLFVSRELSDDKKALLASIADRKFGIPNEVREDRRQLALGF